MRNKRLPEWFRVLFTYSCACRVSSMTEEEKSPQTALLVLGMHRSGTSAVTRVLNLLGAHLGSELLATKADNKRGFWEHAEVVAIHERLLTALGRAWHDTRELPYGWLDSIAGRKARGEIIALIRRDMEGERLWAVKDPRMCRLALLWIEALRELGIRARAILIVREPYEAASSLHVRDGLNYPHAYLMWAQHLLDACRATDGIRRVLISYDQLMGDWRMHMSRLERELGIAWCPGIEQASRGVDEFLTPGERHHDAAQMPLELMRDRVPSPCLKKLYQACLATSLDADWRRLTELGGQFEAVATLFATPLDEITRDRDEAARLGDAQGTLALERLERIHQLEGYLAQATKDRSVFEALVQERLERIHHLEARLTSVTQERGMLEALALERIKRISQLEKDLAVRVNETQQVREQLEYLFGLAGSRWWAFKRVLRPLRPVASGPVMPE